MPVTRNMRRDRRYFQRKQQKAYIHAACSRLPEFMGRVLTHDPEKTAGLLDFDSELQCLEALVGAHKGLVKAEDKGVELSITKFLEIQAKKRQLEMAQMIVAERRFESELAGLNRSNYWLVFGWNGPAAAWSTYKEWLERKLTLGISWRKAGKVKSRRDLENWEQRIMEDEYARLLREEGRGESFQERRLAFWRARMDRLGLQPEDEDSGIGMGSEDSDIEDSDIEDSDIEDSVLGDHSEMRSVEVKVEVEE